MRMSLLKKIRGLRALPTVPLAATMLFLGFALEGVLFTDGRTYVLEASTSHLDLSFSGPRNVWYFPEAVICTLRTDAGALPAGENAAGGDGPASGEQAASATATASAPVCDPTVYGWDDREDLVVSWPEGAGARVTMDQDGTLVVESGIVGLGGRSIPSGSGGDTVAAPPDSAVTPSNLQADQLLVVPAQAWRAQPALTFEARTVIGREMSPGALHYLQDGRWEAWQENGFLFMERPSELVKEGLLSTGAEVSVQARDGRPAVMFGHVVPAVGNDEGFAVTAISVLGDTEIRLVHFGFDEAVVIRPDLFDAVATSTILIAVGVLLTLLAGSSQVARDILFRARRDPGPRGGVRGRPPAVVPTLALKTARRRRKKTDDARR